MTDAIHVDISLSNHSFSNVASARLHLLLLRLSICKPRIFYGDSSQT
jgi:hypothetical protein